MERLETSTKNIHYEFRTTHLMIDKKLNTMNTDYNNMQEQVKTLQMERPIDKYLSSNHFLRNSSHLKSRKSKQISSQKSGRWPRAGRRTTRGPTRSPSYPATIST